MTRRPLEARTVARVVAAFGFDALRGKSGTGTGAAPAHRLAELHLDGVDDDKRTVAKKAAQGIPAGAPPSSTATPFDFAFASLFDWSRNGGQASFEAALEIMAEVVVPLGPEGIVESIASLLRLTVQAEFDDPGARFLTGYGVQALALDYLREQEFRRATRPADGPEGADESLAWATWLTERRRNESRRTTQGYEAVLSLGLLRIRRRPKPGYTVGRIVRAAQSLWVGELHRAFLLPDEYPEYGPGAPPAPLSEVTGLPEGNGQIERAMVDLIMGMTEESLFSVNQASLEGRLIFAGLHRYRTAERTVDLDGLVDETGTNATFARERFPSDQALAAACLQWLAGEWEGFEPFARQFRTAAIGGVETLLDWVASVRRDFPALLDAAAFTCGNPAFEEVVAFVAMVLAPTSFGMSGSVGPDDVRRARRCVEAAAGGGDWRALTGPSGRDRRGTVPTDPAG